MSIAFSNTVEIDAAPETVWKVLTDFPAYAEWNPFMSRVDGTAKVGTKLTVRLTPNGRRGMTFKPTVLAAVPGSELRWLGSLGVKGIFDGEHSFVLTPTGQGGTRLVQSEVFSGVLVRPMKASLSDTDSDFAAFNEALKQRVQTMRLA